jgi:hypothetical protein
LSKSISSHAKSKYIVDLNQFGSTDAAWRRCSGGGQICHIKCNDWAWSSSLDSILLREDIKNGNGMVVSTPNERGGFRPEAGHTKNEMAGCNNLHCRSRFSLYMGMAMWPTMKMLCQDNTHHRGQDEQKNENSLLDLHKRYNHD